jgi:hypothetical protein
MSYIHCFHEVGANRVHRVNVHQNDQHDVSIMSETWELFACRVY